MFEAFVQSPLGEILLQADTKGLAGLFFTDQQDCPHSNGQNHGSPADGMLGNRQLRKFKLKPRLNNKQQALFSNQNQESGFINTADQFLINLENYDFGSYKLTDPNTPADIELIFQQTAAELNQYWHGKRTTFTMPLNPTGTSFQNKVWQALLRVPLGKTMSYGELGQMAGFGSKHGRAIGTAVGSNPISIIIPCHRILASDGCLNGYGGGLNRKAYLLEIEGFELV